MSRQLKDLKVYPLTDQIVQIVTDQQDYTPSVTENKIIIRTPDHFPLGLDTVHAGLKDGYGKILSVVSSDPLSVTTTGFGGLDLDGYDGLVVGNDGYYRARGVITSESSAKVSLNSPAYTSVNGHHYVMGGVDIDTDGYVNDVWHSPTALVWERLETPPWSARGNAQLVTDGSDLWLLGGWNGTTPQADIWHAAINLGTGELTWDAYETATDVDLFKDYFKATIHPTTLDAYVGSGAVSLADGTETANAWGADGYDSIIHYDPDRNILWHSKDGFRKEYIIGDNGEHHYVDNRVPVFGHVHYESVASTVWDVSHGLNSTEVAPICYTEDKEMLIPSHVTWVDSDNLKLHFTVAQAGRAITCHAKYYSGSTWSLTDGYVDGASAWIAVDTTGDLLEPNTTPTSSSLGFTSSEDGYLVAWQPYNGVNALAGRRYVVSDTFIQGQNEYELYQQAQAPLTWFRDTSNPPNLIEPQSYDYTDDKFMSAYFSSSETAIWTTMDMRHDGYRDDQEPFDIDVVSFGTNSVNTNLCYLLGSGGVWATGDAGVHWTRELGVNAKLPTDRLIPVLPQGNMVAGLSDNYDLTRSLNGGASFTQYSNALAEQVVTWYGDLGVPVDSTYRLFIYKRPGDVVWESEYGHLPGDINDDYSTHYVLPYPTPYTGSANTQALSITLDSAYGRAVTANEFENDWLYMITAATGEVVDRKRIIRHTGAAAGSSITIYPKELKTSPTASHVFQIVKNRPEGVVYVTALTREAALRYTLHHESDGTAFIRDREQEYDWYAHLVSQSGLPSLVQTDANLQRVNTLHTELNRQRVMSRVFYNDEDTLPPELLERLGHQIGADIDENLDLTTQRRIISLWHERVDAYGPCLDGVNNLIDLVLGPDSGVTASVANPNADTLAGQVLTVTVSNYGDYQFDYVGATNVTLYDSEIEKWGIALDVTEVPADLSSLVHSSLVHFRGLVVDGPLLIIDHNFNSVTGALNVYFDSSRITELAFDETDSTLAIYDEPKQRAMFKFVSMLRDLVPHWLTVKLA